MRKACELSSVRLKTTPFSRSPSIKMKNQQFTTETIEEFAQNHGLSCEAVAGLFGLPYDWERTEELSDYEITFDDVAFVEELIEQELS